VPALPPYIIEPIFEQFCALLAEHKKTDHPLGCHRQRIPNRVVFVEKLLQILVFGCAYERIADGSCSESTLRRRREEWIELGVMERLSREISLDAYDRLIGLEPTDLAVDCCITKAPCGGEKAARSPVDRGKAGVKRSTVVDAQGIPLGTITAPANRLTTRRCWRRPSSTPFGATRRTLPAEGATSVHLGRAYDDSDATREKLWRLVACSARSPGRASPLRLEPVCVGL
jgi:hypothetical protein